MNGGAFLSSDTMTNWLLGVYSKGAQGAMSPETIN